MLPIKLELMPCFLEETFEDIKGEIRSRKLKNTIIQWHKKKQKKRTKEQSMLYKTLQRKPSNTNSAKILIHKKNI